jgi:hypothetical protein
MEIVGVVQSDVKKLIQKHLNQHTLTDLKYPNRLKEIHKVPCKKCPSIIDKINGVIDPEVEDTRSLSRKEQLKTVFTCGWRPSKLCKGYCDDFSITEKDLII